MSVKIKFGKITFSLLSLIATIVVIVAVKKLINHNVILVNVATAKALIQRIMPLIIADSVTVLTSTQRMTP